MNVPIARDFLLEGDEAVNLALALGPNAPAGAALGGSQSAVLTIENDTSRRPSVQIESITPIANGQFVIRAGGTDGQRVVLQTSENLVGWTSTTTNTVTGGMLEIVVPHAPNVSQKFFRLLLVP